MNHFWGIAAAKCVSKVRETLCAFTHEAQQRNMIDYFNLQTHKQDR